MRRTRHSHLAPLKEAAYRIGQVGPFLCEVDSAGYATDLDFLDLSDRVLLRGQRAATVYTVFAQSARRAIDSLKEGGLVLAKEAVTHG